MENLNGYIAMYRGKKIEMYANTSYEAQQLAAKKFNARKSWEVDVYLCESKGQQVTQSTSF